MGVPTDVPVALVVVAVAVSALGLLTSEMTMVVTKAALAVEGGRGSDDVVAARR